jgi:hypothetical protein
MSSFSDRLLSDEKPQEEQVGSFSNRLLGDGPVLNADPIAADKSRDLGFMDMVKGGFASDPGEEIRFYASQLYPDEPLERSTKRFGVEDGVAYHVGKDGKRSRLYPGGLGALKQSGKSVGKAIPAGASAATGIFTAPMAATGLGFAGSVALTGAAGGGGELARQKIGDAMFDEDIRSPGMVNYKPIVDETMMGALGQGVGFGLTAAANRAVAKDIPDLNVQEMRETVRAASRANVRVTPAEASNLSSLKAQQKRLSNTLPAANKMEKFYSERDDEVMTYFGRFLDDISQASDAEDVGRSARDAAEEVLRTVRANRSAQAKPYYDRAFLDETSVVDTSGIIQGMDDQIARASNTKLAQVLQRVRDAMAPDGVPKTAVEELHYVKLEIDNLLENPRENGIGRTIARNLNEVKAGLLEQMDEASPHYAEARSIFSKESDPVDEAVGSAITTLSKIKDDRLRKATVGIFDPTNRSPEGVRSLKSYYTATDPDAWQSIKRLYLLEKGEQALRLSQDGSVHNAAGKFYVAFGRPNMRANIKAALSTKEARAFDDFMKVMQTSSRVRPLGSDTAWNQAIQKEAADTARPLVAKLVRNANPAKLLQASDELLTNRKLNKHDTKLVDLITSGDPEVIATIKELRKLSPGSVQARILLGHLSVRAGRFGVEKAIPDRDHIAEEERRSTQTN